MSHYTVMVKYQGKIDNYIEKVAELLEPYNEQISVTPYVTHYKSKQKEYLKKRLDELLDELKEIINTNDKKQYNMDRCKEEYARLSKITAGIYWEELTGGDKLDKDGNATSTYNPDSKWDWYTVGGRWSGLLNLKKNKFGIEGESGVRDNRKGIDIAYFKDIDWSKMKDFNTYAVLDENGWHEASKMGWFGVSYNQTEDETTWASKFKARFLDTCDRNTVIVIVDCHI